jgi:ABC-type tungstate transport system substrate-binding protein
MFENKNVKRYLYVFLIALVIYINMSNADGIIWCLIYDTLAFLPHLLLAILLWVLFSDKLTRASISCIGLYWFYDWFLACLFRINRDLAEILNTKYAYMFSLVIGLILFLFYSWIRKKKT